MGIACVRAIHHLHLEAEVIVGGFGIKRALDGQQQLIEQRPVGFVGEQMTEIQSVRRTVWVKRDAGVHDAGHRDRIPPIGWRRRRGGLGGKGNPAREAKESAGAESRHKKGTS
jgi:hypothetical protein